MNVKSILRTSSYFVLIGTILYIVHEVLTPSQACGHGGGMSCMGNGIGEAVILLATALALLLLASLLNAIGFAISPVPRSGWRKFELIAFQIPLTLIAIVAIQFFV